MAKISIENGVYTNLDNAYPSGKTGLGAQRIANGGNPVNDLENGDIATKLVNAIEIDWNGAEITSTAFPAMDRTINTTGDLLSWIKEGIEETAVSGRTSEVVRRSLWIN